MNSLSEHILFVKGQIEFHQKKSEMYSNDLPRKSLHESTSQKFADLLTVLLDADQHISNLTQQLANIKSTSDNSASCSRSGTSALTKEELEGLPEELLKELNISNQEPEFIIQDILEKNGGILSIDRILVYYYKQTKEVEKRTKMASRLYRMTQKGTLFSVPHKKGVYSLYEVSPDTSEEEI